MSGILHVCQANRCRSPVAVLISRQLMATWPEDQQVPVWSAGTDTRGGAPMWPAAAQSMLERGLGPVDILSRPLMAAQVKDADLVLAATRALRDDVVTQVPRSLNKIFTWRELAWLLEGVRYHEVPGETPAERVAAIAGIARGRRGLRAMPPGEQFDVDDPVHGPPEALEPAVEQIAQSLVRLFGLIGPY